MAEKSRGGRGRAREGKAQQDRAGQGRAWNDRAQQGRTGYVRAERSRAEQGRAGRAGYGRAGYGRVWQVRAGPGLSRRGQDRAEQGRAGRCRHGSAQRDIKVASSRTRGFFSDIVTVAGMSSADLETKHSRASRDDKNIEKHLKLCMCVHYQLSLIF